MTISKDYMPIYDQVNIQYNWKQFYFLD